MNSLFSNFEEIYEIHNHFLEDLIQAKHSDCVGDIFLRNVYIIYLSFFNLNIILAFIYSG